MAHDPSPKRAPRVVVAPRPFTIATRRVEELWALARHRHGVALPAGETRWVRVLVDSLIWRADAEAKAVPTARQLIEVIRLAGPRFGAAGVRDTVNRALTSGRGRWTAPALGNWLGVTPEERKTLGLRTIRAAGQTKTQMIAAKKAADRDRAAAKRRAAGKPTLAERWADTAVAEAARLGVSERTVRRRRKEKEMSKCPVRVATTTSFPTREPNRTRAQFRSVGPGFSLLVDRGFAMLSRPLGEPDPPVVLTPGARQLLGLFADIDAKRTASAGRR